MKAAGKKVIEATRKQVLKTLREWVPGDFERAHADGDAALVRMLRTLGEEEIADAYEAIPERHCA